MSASKVFLGVTVVAATAVFGFPAVSNAAQDRSAPEVVSVNPVADAIDAPVDVAPTATFTEPLKSVPLVTLVSGRSLVPATSSLDETKTVLTVKPGAILPLGTKFTVTLLLIRDSKKNVLPSYSWSFTTDALPAQSKGLVALTFDDGPDKTRTPAVLNTLKAKGIKATFFLNGNKIKGNEAIVKRMQDEGHVIGNHGWDHTNFKDTDEDPDNGFTPLTPEQARASIVNTNNAIQSITGVKPILFRYPYGDSSAAGDQVVRSEGMWDVLWRWTVNPPVAGTTRKPIVFEGDWQCEATQTQLQQYVVLNTVNQAVILLHDAGDASSCALSHWNYLGPTIELMKATGWEFGVVDIAYAPSPENQQSWIKVIAVTVAN